MTEGQRCARSGHRGIPVFTGGFMVLCFFTTRHRQGCCITDSCYDTGRPRPVTIVSDLLAWPVDTLIPATSAQPVNLNPSAAMPSVSSFAFLRSIGLCLEPPQSGYFSAQWSISGIFWKLFSSACCGWTLAAEEMQKKCGNLPEKHSEGGLEARAHLALTPPSPSLHGSELQSYRTDWGKLITFRLTGSCSANCYAGAKFWLTELHTEGPITLKNRHKQTFVAPLLGVGKRKDRKDQRKFHRDWCWMIAESK